MKLVEPCMKYCNTIIHINKILRSKQHATLNVDNHLKCRKYIKMFYKHLKIKLYGSGFDREYQEI